jgi:hypothetical protein
VVSEQKTGLRPDVRVDRLGFNRISHLGWRASRHPSSSGFQASRHPSSSGFQTSIILVRWGEFETSIFPAR